MNQKIYPHQYHALHQQINDLINAYQSVNDFKRFKSIKHSSLKKSMNYFLIDQLKLNNLKVNC